MTQGLSRRQMAMLRYIGRREVTMDELRHAHQITLWSLVYRGYIQRGPQGRVYVTQEGDEALADYSRAEMVSRQRDGDLSERVQALLRYAKAYRAG